jgi:hypothetical protein
MSYAPLVLVILAAFIHATWNLLSIGIGGSLSAPPTGSPEAVARLRLPQNVACGFTALRSSTVDSQHWSFRCYLFKFCFHGRLIFSLHRRPCLPLNGAHVAQEQFTCR